MLQITQPHLRGTLSALASVAVSLGVLIEYGGGAATSWPILAGMSAALPCTALLLTALCLPETPSWLLARGKTERARKSLHRLRADTCDIEKELNDLETFRANLANARANSSKPQNYSVWRSLFEPASLKPFSILVLYFLIYQFSGVNSITFYAVEVFRESYEGNDYNLTVALGVVRLIFTVLACGMLRRCGRRPLTFVSSVGCGITMLSLGTYMYFAQVAKEAGEVLSVPAWFPVACIFCFTAASTVGYLVVPWVMIGEVYPSRVRGLLGGLTTCAAHMFVFTVVKTFPLLQQVAGVYGSFWIYGIVSMTGTLFFYFFLPETKGRTLEEIEDYFAGRSKTLDKAKVSKPIVTAT
jgi:facilitated trehalose transporter